MILLAIVAISIPMSAFAEPMIELSTAQTNIKELDSVLIMGKITGVEIYKPVKLSVTAPDGEVIYSPELPFDNQGVFKRLLHPTLPSFKEGTYTVIASHPDTSKTAQVKFTVLGKSEFPTKPTPGPVGEEKPSVITLTTEAVFGDNKITVKGSTTTTQTDITFRINSPNGNLVSIAQITPNTDGTFSFDIVTGGPLWKENGMYTITANQGILAEHKQSTQVEINNGVVVPEFGVVAFVILAVAITSVILVSTKSRGIFPKY